MTFQTINNVPVNSNGVATTTITPPEGSEGNYTIIARYKRNDKYNANMNSAGMVINSPRTGVVDCTSTDSWINLDIDTFIQSQPQLIDGYVSNGTETYNELQPYTKCTDDNFHLQRGISISMDMMLYDNSNYEYGLTDTMGTNFYSKGSNNELVLTETKNYESSTHNLESVLPVNEVINVQYVINEEGQILYFDSLDNIVVSEETFTNEDLLSTNIHFRNLNGYMSILALEYAYS